MAHTDNSTPARPLLKAGMRVEDFRRYYWLKKELETFCRSNGLSASGGKIAIANRIEAFLTTGHADQPPPGEPRRQPSAEESAELSLDTPIRAGFVCTQRHRRFFQEAIGPKFRFSTFIQNFLKANVGKTYRDVVAAWHEEEARKKGGQKTTIAPQFEYNQFTRDFFNDPKNRGKAREEAIRAWKRKRSQPGDNRYSPDDTYD